MVLLFTWNTKQKQLSLIKFIYTCSWCSLSSDRHLHESGDVPESSQRAVRAQHVRGDDDAAGELHTEHRRPGHHRVTAGGESFFNICSSVIEFTVRYDRRVANKAGTRKCLLNRYWLIIVNRCNNSTLFLSYGCNTSLDIGSCKLNCVTVFCSEVFVIFSQVTLASKSLGAPFHRFSSWDDKVNDWPCSVNSV